MKTCKATIHTFIFTGIIAVLIALTWFLYIHEQSSKLREPEPIKITSDVEWATTTISRLSYVRGQDLSEVPQAITGDITVLDKKAFEVANQPYLKLITDQADYMIFTAPTTSPEKKGESGLYKYSKGKSTLKTLKAEYVGYDEDGTVHKTLNEDAVYDSKRTNGYVSPGGTKFIFMYTDRFGQDSIHYYDFGTEESKSFGHMWGSWVSFDSSRINPRQDVEWISEDQLRVGLFRKDSEADLVGYRIYSIDQEYDFDKKQSVFKNNQVSSHKAPLFYVKSDEEEVVIGEVVSPLDIDAYTALYEPHLRLLSEQAEYMIFTSPCFAPKECGDSGLYKYRKADRTLSTISIDSPPYLDFSDYRSVSPDGESLVILRDCSPSCSVAEEVTLPSRIGYLDFDTEKYLEKDELSITSNFSYVSCGLGCDADLKWIDSSRFRVGIFDLGKPSLTPLEPIEYREYSI